MSKIAKYLIGIRAQDFHEGLKEVPTDPLIEVEFRNTVLIGKAATLAMHLKGLLHVSDYRALQYMAAQLGIRVNELDVVLKELHEIEFINVVKVGGRFKRLEIKVPELRDGYEDLGERWEYLKPTGLEQAGVTVLQNVIELPRTEFFLLDDLNVDSSDVDIIMDVGSAGALIDKYEIPGEEPIFYSPLCIEEDPRPIIELAERFPAEEIVKSFETINEYQGLPRENRKIRSNEIIEEAILSGVLAPTKIDTPQGEKQFLFTPRSGIKKEEKIILDKARAILACVRSGQHYAVGRAIHKPRRILETLRYSKRFKKSHPDLKIQYGALVAKQIGIPIEGPPGRYNFKVNDTPENIKAFDVAIEMLEIGEAPSARIDLSAKKLLLQPSSYTGAITTRARVAKNMQRSKTSQTKIIEELTKIARGIHYE